MGLDNSLPISEVEDLPTQDLSTSSVTNLWDQDLVTDESETYQSLIRGVRRTSGFRLFFVSCSRNKGAELIKNLAIDLPQRKFATLSITEPIDNLYNRISELPNLAQLDTIFIQGLEHSIFEYEDREFKDINLRSTAKVYSGTTLGVPPLFAHLNMQRERFRDDFPICFVFLLPDFALNYFVRRAPDFFDWRSQSFQFFTDKDITGRDSKRLWIEGNYQEYLTWTPEQRRDKALEIKECLDEVTDLDLKFSLLVKLGNILLADNRYVNSINAYDRALVIKPDYHEAWNDRGFALDELDRYEESIASYDRALAIKPDDNQAWYNRGIALDKLGRYEEAISSYDRALSIKPDDDQAWNNRGFALGQIGKTEEAISSYDQALEIKSDKDQAWYNRGNDLDELGRTEEAIVSYNRALAINPDRDEAWCNRGAALCKLGRYEEAIASYDRALAIKLDDFSSIYNKACAYALQQQIDLAIQFLQQVIQVEPQYYRKMAKTDADFDSIRDDARFQTLIAY